MNASAPVTRTYQLVEGLSLTVDEYGTATDGSAVLLLHGGAGPRTMAGLGTALSEHAYVINPTHPGFDGSPRPDWADSVGDLADAYLDLLDALDLTGVMVIGNSLGGWIAAEMALRDNRSRIGCLALLNAVGIRADSPEDVTDVRLVPPGEISKLSFANPAFRPDFSSLSDDQRAVMGANQKVLATYAGGGFMQDPKLRRRLHRVTVPALVVWGEQDGIVSPTYGRAWAGSFPENHFVLVPDAGHFPHIEQPGRTLGAIGVFVDTVVKSSVSS